MTDLRRLEDSQYSVRAYPAGGALPDDLAATQAATWIPVAKVTSFEGVDATHADGHFASMDGDTPYASNETKSTHSVNMGHVPNDPGQAFIKGIWENRKASTEASGRFQVMRRMLTIPAIVEVYNVQMLSRQVIGTGGAVPGEVNLSLVTTSDVKEFIEAAA